MFSDEYSFEWNLNAAQLPPAEPVQVAVAPAPAEAWSDAHTIAYVRAGWSKVANRDGALALRLLDDLCKPPSDRSTAWIMLVRTAQGLTAPTAKAAPDPTPVESQAAV